MTRVNVYAYPATEYDETSPRLVGWFNPDSAVEYKEDTVDGERSVNPVPEFSHQSLYHTAKGRWVLCTWSQYQGTEARHEFVDEAAAKDWLLRNAEDAAAEKWFGQLDEESGPNLGGRPPIGAKWEVRLDDETQRRVTAYAGVRPRADVLRELITAGLDALESA
ncbi:hypothetical protein AB0G74_30535 [Streptomyces sp. NPDC020875]|uniref:hypothetical protein n=1 Tax=Streptomyces sp. NPDC020875 TaxID=3154898 RepID=UPI0033CCA4C7